MDVPLRCLSLDLEVARDGSRILALAGVLADTGRSVARKGRDLTDALDQLDKLADQASYLLGHNLIGFDLPQLAAAKPDLRLLELPVIDTLRLSPLAFPRNPYHHLVKHYQDGGLTRRQLNDPKLDAELTLELFEDEHAALREHSPDLLAAWHWLCTPDAEGFDRALDEFFHAVRGAARPSAEAAWSSILQRLDDNCCATQSRWLCDSSNHFESRRRFPSRWRMQERPGAAESVRFRWALAYVLAWLSVSGGNSVMPPWVRHQFPEAGRLVHRLRDTACTDTGCAWCREFHDAGKELERWFGFPGFRAEPALDDGMPMQQAIVEAVMAGEHVLGILPTGTGKSLCYQIPALSKYDRIGALTVVISPLVALMADQVAGLERRGIGACVTVNGLLSMPERADALDRIRLGDAGILLIAPEQLRSRTLRRALDQREIGAWVVDEAHCLSKWGHDFRPDYRYLGRFIKEKAGTEPAPPVLCLTATAKPDVIEDIVRYFKDTLDIGLRVFDGGTERSNLTFEIVPTTPEEKYSHVHQVLESCLPAHTPGGAIIYCATRRQTEEVVEFLQLKGVTAERFHAGLPPETKKEVQRSFIAGELRAIAATNAFGMGIDKPDVRLVVHADIPGSLENYLQEAGRAGRDSAAARCVLLYSKDDVERQFGMSAMSRLSRAEIHGILRALRNLDRKNRLRGEIEATAGEILDEDDELAFQRDSATDDTRVRTAIAWLEESQLLSREENAVKVFPSSLRVGSLDEARSKLAKASVADVYRAQLLSITNTLIDADPDEGVSTDELMSGSGLSPEGVRNALYDLERLGISSNDTALTAFVHSHVARASIKRLGEAAELETALVAHMREAAPDLGKGGSSWLHLRLASQALRDAGHADPLPERLWRILRSIAWDGRGEDGAAGSLSLRKRDSESVRVTLQREWQALEETAELRRGAAIRLLDHLLACLPSGERGTDLLVETTLGKLTQAMEDDLTIRSRIRHPSKLLERALLWLHEQEVIRLNKGMAVFRPAMTIRLVQRERRGFARADFEPLALHYKGRILQIHVMAEYAERGLASMTEALRLTMDYFELGEADFLDRWLPGRDKEVGRETTPDSWRQIVESLRNPVQQRIVADEREATNVLVLAGPGSGKTRVLVHRIAWLLRVKRQPARGVLALAYNRHAAVEIRRRLNALVGHDARGVTVLTCHALAMRLVGASFVSRADRPDDETFDEVMRQAVDVLKGADLPQDEAHERRARILAGFRWILVDEYQDIGKDQYELISALAGRTLDDDAGKLTLFAVGDDDQNIYAFNGTSVEFIRRFEQDYGPKPFYLTDNYRSTAHIVAAGNIVIEPARERMKGDHPIRIDRVRAKDRAGGAWEEIDPVVKGRVQILPAGRTRVSQAQAVMTEFLRLADLTPHWDWSTAAVIAREWQYLEPVRAFCESRGIPVQMGNEEIPSFWRLRETRALVDWLRARDSGIVEASVLQGWLGAAAANQWNDLLRQAVDEHHLETGGAEVATDRFIEWLAEWGRDIRRRQRGVMLVTAHRAKGLEFDHVAVLDGGWDGPGRRDNDPDEARRLYYVAMTRARMTLVLARFAAANRFQDALSGQPFVVRRKQVSLSRAEPILNHRLVHPGLDKVDLGFAGRKPGSYATHRAIARLAAGDRLQLRVTKSGRWELLNKAGTVVGQLAARFEPPPEMRCREVSVHAIVHWNRDISQPEFQKKVKCDTWEVVVPRMVFEPDPTVVRRPHAAVAEGRPGGRYG